MRKQLFYRCLLWLAIWAGNMGINRAQSVVLTLGETIELAADSSLEAFRTRNLYLSGYWEFRNYKAERLPSLTLNLTPAQYYHDITRRYDSEADIDVYLAFMWIPIWGICVISVIRPTTSSLRYRSGSAICRT